MMILGAFMIGLGIGGLLGEHNARITPQR
jgi:hypothetical protein